MLKKLKYYSELEIKQELDVFIDYYADTPGCAYINTTTNKDGKVKSFYIGMEDDQGRAITGYDQHRPERSI